MTVEFSTPSSFESGRPEGKGIHRPSEKTTCGVQRAIRNMQRAHAERAKRNGQWQLLSVCPPIPLMDHGAVLAPLAVLW